MKRRYESGAREDVELGIEHARRQRFGIGKLAHEDVAGGVDAAFGIGVEHDYSLELVSAAAL